ncbi:MAG TPA: SAM-dependent methyltransferase [Aliiroseovarius sp.]|nr:SAM-dependent methyltransferase [Aliiroseovarius sp.]
MQTPPPLTDLTRLALNRDKAEPDAMFLHQEALLELQDRIEMVNRTFTKPAIVTGFPDFWAEKIPNALIVPESEVLDLKPQAHDLVIHALSLHWANDPVGQLVQCQRALVPDGFFIAALFGGQTLAGLRTALAEAESQITGGLSPRVLPMGEIRDLGGLLQRAGFALPVADSSMRNVTYADMFALMRDVRAMGEGNALASRNHAPANRRMFERAAEIYAAQNPAENGRVLAQFELMFLSGWAPHESQQKPLRPGSAQMRLADALGARDADVPD